MSRRFPTPLVGALAALSSLLLAGCFTGQRPTLRDRPQLDDPAAQAVLDRLEIAGTVDFAATYEITPTNTGDTTEARVEQQGGNRTITIGGVAFVSNGTVARTCERDGTTGCVDFLDDARISNLNITHRFWGEAFASRLELDASRRIGFSSTGNATIAGQPAACVDIPVPTASELSGVVQYCALDAGVLARYLGADVTIELTEFALTPGNT